MNVKTLLFIGCFIVPTMALAQTFEKVKPSVNPSKADCARKSSEFSTPISGKLEHAINDKDWRPLLSHKISENESEDNEKIEKIKAKKANIKFAQQSLLSKKTEEDKSILVATPVVGVNFDGNSNNGCPPDHTIAISNGGKIVTIVNSNIEYYDEFGNYLNGISLVDFYNDASLSTNLCDPKVLYDSGADRFIFFTQTCDGDPATSKVLLAFSGTNNPTGAWNYYKLTGNPRNDNSWFDYPKIAVSNNEFYCTGNLFSASGTFKYSVVYQINKQSGYSGNSLTWQFWDNISGNPFTLKPVSFGQQGNYGPGVYLVASASGGSSNIKMYDLTDDITATNETMNLYNVTVPSYSVAANAAQSGSSNLLHVGDCRMQDGFYLNGLIHYVYTADSVGYSTVRYNRLDISTLVNKHISASSTGVKDYCYPSVASFSNVNTDKSVLINFLASGSGVYPETRVKYIDDAMLQYGSISVKQGVGSVTNCYSSSRNSARWGDYSGIGKRYNRASSVWVNGGYGKSSGAWGTWVAEIHDQTTPTESASNSILKSNVFPNPIIDIWHLDVNTEEMKTVEINLYDVSGKLIKNLYKGNLLVGENDFSFNRGILSNGTYFLTISDSSNHKILKNEKIIVAY
ncbi:MAG: hypothetical protein RLZZ292_3245 [Bacteroidota bacterium]|jgi:hypothetical protein